VLTPEQITRLVARGGIKASAGHPKNRWFDGFEWHTGKPPANVRFEGKAGTMRRSRKGATRRMPNGSRYVVGQYDEPQVLAYKVTP
jgi:hypothetical protein